jgi:hypothetical protein
MSASVRVLESHFLNFKRVLESRVSIHVGVVILFPCGNKVTLKVLTRSFSGLVGPSGSVKSKEISHYLAAKDEVPRFVAVMKQVDLSRQRNEPLIARHRDVVHVYDLFKDENPGEEEKVLFPRLIISRKDHFLVRIDLSGVPRAEAAEVDHVFVLLIQKVMQVASDLIIAFSVKALGKPLYKGSFAVDVEAEEIDRLIKTEPLLIRLRETIIDIRAVKGD